MAMRVVICDDEPDIRLLFRMECEERGAEVVEANDGDECLARLDDGCADVIILDLFMPNRDGMSALPEIRARCPEASIFVVSAHSAVDVFAKSRARGANACFEKLNFASRIPHLLETRGGAA